MVEHCAPQWFSAQAPFINSSIPNLCSVSGARLKHFGLTLGEFRVRGKAKNDSHHKTISQKVGHQDSPSSVATVQCDSTCSRDEKGKDGSKLTIFADYTVRIG